MKWLNSLVGGGAADLVDSTTNLIDRTFTSDDERNKHKEVIEKLKDASRQRQHELNLAGAGRNMFIAGWRPALGWIGAISLFMYYVPQYTIASILWVKQTIATGVLGEYPASADGLMELVVILLGAQGLRSYEKTKGVSK